MNPLRLTHRRHRGQGWVAGNIDNYGLYGRPAFHTLCYYSFRKFFKLPSSVQDIDIVISKTDPEFDGAYKVRVRQWDGASNSSRMYYIEWYNDKRDRWERLPLVNRSVEYLTNKISDRWRRIKDTYYVWVEHD